MAEEENKLSTTNSNPYLRSHSRSRGPPEDRRSLSRTRRGNNAIKWSILNHDPSERIRIDPEDEQDGKQKTNEDDDDEEWEEDSEEEQISDTDNEFTYDDGGSILPNFATYSKKPIVNLHEQAQIDLDNATNRLKDLSIDEANIKKEEESDNQENIIKQARKVTKFQELQALDEALKNALGVGAPIPQETIDIIQTLNDEEKKYIDVSLINKGHKGLYITEDSADENHKKNNQSMSESTLKKYFDYKQKITSNNDDRNFNAPYTYDKEIEEDIELAESLNKKIQIGEIDSNIENSRCIRTITRGDFFQSLSINQKPNTYLICMDFSQESLYALEWCIGTVLSNNSVIFIVYVIEEERSLLSRNNKDSEQVRLDGVDRLTKLYLELLKLTKLQVHAVIEVIHHPIPRHLIIEIIDHIQPTLVVVGSKGKHALQGVLLGSLSNYLVTKSSVPVMVVRKELKKTLKKKRTTNYSSMSHSIIDARVD